MAYRSEARRARAFRQIRSSSRGNGAIELPRRAGLGLCHQAEHLFESSRTEGPTPGEQLVEDDAQAEDVGAAIDPMPLAPGLLGAHVGRRPGVARAGAEVRLTEGQAEVGHIGPCRSYRAGCCRA